MRREVEELRGVGGGRGVGWRWKEREGLTLRGGLRRRVTINDCEIRIRGGRVSMQ